MLIAFVGERTSGTLFRLLASPLKESELVAGYAVAFGAIGAAQSAVLLAVAVLLFHITIVGNVFLSFGVIALLAIVAEGLGILLSSFARREAQAVQFYHSLYCYHKTHLGQRCASATWTYIR